MRSIGSPSQQYAKHTFKSCLKQPTMRTALDIGAKNGFRGGLELILKTILVEKFKIL